MSGLRDVSGERPAILASLEIPARAERAVPGAGQHDDKHLVVILGCFEGLDQFPHRRDVQRIALFRIVDGDFRDPVADFQQHILVRHLSSPFSEGPSLLHPIA